MMRTRIAASAATLALFGAAGCGDDGASGASQATTFRVSYAAKSAKIEALGTAVADELGRAGQVSDAELEKGFARLAVRSRALVDELQALDPPKELAAPLATLQRSVEKAAGDLEAITKAAATKDTDAARTAAQALVADSAPIRDARAALDQRLNP